MRDFNYTIIRDNKWDSELLGLIAAIYKEAGKQEMYLKQRPEELDKLVRQLRENDDEDLAKDFMAHFYRSFAISNFSVSQYAKFLHYVMKTEDPVLWHCSMGKDRCGIATLMILELLNVDRESIKEDYLYTNEVYGIYDTDTESGFDIADESYIEAFYDEVEKVYGDMSSFFEEMNIDDKEIYEFRQRVLI